MYLQPARPCVVEVRALIARARSDADCGIWSPQLLTAPLILVLFINRSCPGTFISSPPLMRWPRDLWGEYAVAARRPVPHLLPTTVRYSISCLVSSLSLVSSRPTNPTPTLSVSSASPLFDIHCLARTRLFWRSLGDSWDRRITPIHFYV